MFRFVDFIPSPIARDKFMSNVLPDKERAFPLSAAVIPDGNVILSICELMKRSIVCSMSADRALCSSTVFSRAIRSVSFSGGLMSLLTRTTDRRSPRTLNPATLKNAIHLNLFMIIFQKVILIFRFVLFLKITSLTRLMFRLDSLCLYGDQDYGSVRRR